MISALLKDQIDAHTRPDISLLNLLKDFLGPGIYRNTWSDEEIKIGSTPIRNLLLQVASGPVRRKRENRNAAQPIKGHLNDIDGPSISERRLENP